MLDIGHLGAWSVFLCWMFLSYCGCSQSFVIYQSFYVVFRLAQIQTFLWVQKSLGAPPLAEHISWLQLKNPSPHVKNDWRKLTYSGFHQSNALCLLGWGPQQNTWKCSLSADTEQADECKQRDGSGDGEARRGAHTHWGSHTEWEVCLWITAVRKFEGARLIHLFAINSCLDKKHILRQHSNQIGVKIKEPL